MNKITHYLTNILFNTNQCSLCFSSTSFEKSGLRTFLCHQCANIEPLAPFSFTLGTRVVKLYTIGAYRGSLEALIGKKYSRNPVIFRQLGKELATLITQNPPFDFLMPIPLHPLKRGIRWFNQAEEIAYGMSEIMNIPLIHNLKRVRYTSSQVLLKGFTARKKNVENAFSCTDPHLLKNKRLLIIDDVYTSGATLKEAIQILVEYSPETIHCATIARAI